MKFLPFYEVKKHESVLIVDSYFSGKVMFSHWRGAPKISNLHDDTSTGIVLNALRAKHPACELSYVSNNHFDIDGFLGIWALINPDLALVHETLLREAAVIGDFREWNPNNLVADLALKLCCWINYREKELFYKPFGEKVESRACVDKYAYFLTAFEAFIINPDSFEDEFQEEYNLVWDSYKQIETHGSIERVGDIRLQIVHVPNPVHYYALFQDSKEIDMVLSLYANRRYELEYKYTSWVDTEHRMSYPRLDFRPLAEKLNKEETSSFEWEYDRIMDTGPILRLNKAGLSKADRYGQPYDREIHSSSIPPERFNKLIQQHYQEMLTDISPRASWTWKEMKACFT